MSSIRISPQARRDLREIRGGMEHASSKERFIADMRSAFIQISMFPASGFRRRAPRDVRILVRGDYLIVYRVDISPPEVIRVLHGARNYPMYL